MSDKNYIDADKQNGLMKDVGEIEPKPEKHKSAEGDSWTCRILR